MFRTKTTPQRARTRGNGTLKWTRFGKLSESENSLKVDATLESNSRTYKGLNPRNDASTLEMFGETLPDYMRADVIAPLCIAVGYREKFLG